MYLTYIDVDSIVSIDIFGTLTFHATTSPGLSGASLGDPLRSHGHLGLATFRGWLLRAPHLSPGHGLTAGSAVKMGKWMLKLDEKVWKILW